MKPKDILIATALILILSSLLTGCKLTEKSEDSLKPSVATEEQTSKKKPRVPKMNMQEIVKKAAAVKKEVTMTFSSSKEDGKVKVSINLENPNQKPVTSVQSWLSFDTTKLQGTAIETSNSAFLLMAPDGNEFDNTNGLTMIGRSNPDPITDQNIHVAEVIFDITEEGTTMVDVYDYREDLTGHASVNTVVDGEPYNILVKPDSPALVIEK